MHIEWTQQEVGDAGMLIQVSGVTHKQLNKLEINPGRTLPEFVFSFPLTLFLYQGLLVYGVCCVSVLNKSFVTFKKDPEP